MSYIKHSLGQNETLHYKAHFHWLYTAAAWGALLALFSVAAAAHASGRPWVAGVAALAGIAVFLSIKVPIWTTEIGVTNQRFIFKRGLVRRMTNELQLRAVEQVNVRQGVLGRLLNFGRLEVHGTGVDDILLPAIAHPIALQKAIQDGIGVTQRPQQTAS